MLEYIIKYKKILYIAVPIIIIAIIISIILTVNIQKEKAEDEVAVTFKDNLTIEFGTKAKVSDFIENIQGELIDDIEVDTGKLGMQKMKFSYKSIRNKKKTKSFEFTVIDTTKPIIYMGNTITIKKGDTTDITSMIFSGDNCDPSPERKITGELQGDQTQAELILDAGLKMRQLFIDRLKFIYPEYLSILDKITVEINRDGQQEEKYFEIDEQQIGGGED